MLRNDRVVRRERFTNQPGIGFLPNGELNLVPRAAIEARIAVERDARVSDLERATDKDEAAN